MKKILYAGLVAGLCFLFAGSIWAEEKGLVGCWNFDKGKGNIAKDSSDKGNHGKINGAKWTKDGLKFEAKWEDYVDCGNDASLNITDAITISAWVKRDTVGTYQAIVGKYLNTDAQRSWRLMFWNNDAISVWVCEDGSGDNYRSCHTSATFTDTTKFYHIVFTADVSADEYHTYVDGTEETVGNNLKRPKKDNLKCPKSG